MIDTFADLEDVALVHQQPRLLRVPVVVAFENAEPGHPAGSTHDRQGVSETGGGDHRGAGPRISEYGVGRLGGGMHHPLGPRQQRRNTQVDLVGGILQAVENPLLQVGGCAQRLAAGGGAVLVVNDYNVRESSTDIDCDSKHSPSCIKRPELA